MVKWYPPTNLKQREAKFFSTLLSISFHRWKTVLLLQQCRPVGVTDVPAFSLLLKYHRVKVMGLPLWFQYRQQGPLQNHTKLIFYLTISSGKPFGATETIAGGPLPLPYERPPATNYLWQEDHLTRKCPFFLLTTAEQFLKYY